MAIINTKEISEARVQFAIDYCKARNWPIAFHDLSCEQVNEIREKEGWKNPVLLGGRFNAQTKERRF